MDKRAAITIIFIFFLAVSTLSGCSEEPESFSFSRTELPLISFMGFEIPVFPTARDQMNYAKSGFPDSREKIAAFKALFKLFPEFRLECGEAALSLAYLNLGVDYRFAQKKDILAAVQDYNTVLQNFKEVPQIIVKTYWYLGWLHCNLLHEKREGLDFFWQIVKSYPGIQMGISSPVPWVSLVYPATGKTSHPEEKKIKKKWGALALLEIVEHAADKTETVKAFDCLWQAYPGTVSTGLAIKYLLKKKIHIQKVLPCAETYLDLNIANSFLSDEIRILKGEF